MLNYHIMKRGVGMAGAADGSYFDGNTLQRIGWNLLGLLLTVATLGFGFPWAVCMTEGWEARHAVIDGRRLKFTGHGHQLLGRWLLWILLTLLTFGIYGLWVGVKMKKWVVRHTVYEDYDEDEDEESRFTGGVLGWIGHRLLFCLIAIFTLGIGIPWATAMLVRWETTHTEIDGYALEFDGTGGQLFMKYLIRWLLSLVTFGIYNLFFPVVLLKWQTSHISEGDDEAPEEKSSKALVVVMIVAAVAVVLFGLFNVVSPIIMREIMHRNYLERQANKAKVEQALPGEWSSAHLEDAFLFVDRYTFIDDGTILIRESVYQNIAYTSDPYEYETDEYGWYMAHVNPPATNGSYSLTPSADYFWLRVDGTVFETGDGSRIGDDKRTRKLVYLDDDTIEIDGQTFFRGTDYTLAEYAEKLGFSIQVDGYKPRVQRPAYPSGLSVEEMELYLTGEWSRAYREGDTISVYYYEFMDDGKIQTGFTRYINGRGLYPERGDESFWEIAPMGFPYILGEYTLTPLEDDRFRLDIDAYDYEANRPYQESHEILFPLGEDSLWMDGEYFFPGSNLTLERYAQYFGFSLELGEAAPEQQLSPEYQAEIQELQRAITGDWVYGWREGNYIYLYSYEFLEGRRVRPGYQVYVNTHPYERAGDRNVWELAPMGFPDVLGSYTLTPLTPPGGGLFQLDIDGYDNEAHETYRDSVELYYDYDDLLMVGDFFYRRRNGRSLEQFAEELGILLDF